MRQTGHVQTPGHQPPLPPPSLEGLDYSRDSACRTRRRYLHQRLDLQDTVDAADVPHADEANQPRRDLRVPDDAGGVLAGLAAARAPESEVRAMTSQIESMATNLDDAPSG